MTKDASADAGSSTSTVRVPFDVETRGPPDGGVPGECGRVAGVPIFVARRAAVKHMPTRSVTSAGLRDKLLQAISGAMRLVSGHPYAVGVAGTLVTLAAFAVLLAIMATDYHEKVDHARETSANLSSIIALDLENNFGFYDVQLQDLVHSVEERNTWPLTADILHGQMFRSLPADAYVDDKCIVGASGKIIASQSSRDIDAALRLNDRDYFLEQKNSLNAGLFISHPFRSRLRNGAQSIALSRRINDREGAFAGVAFYEVNLELLQKLFDRIELSETGIVDILLDDGTMLASKPYSESPMEVGVAHSAIFDEMVQHISGTIVATGREHIERMYSYRHVPGLPFIVVVAPSMTDVLQEWRHQVAIVVVAAIVWGLAATGGAWLLAYTLRDKARAQAELARLAATDPLTRLNNRRTLDERLQVEWGRASRNRSAISILFLDIDRFKLFNDRYGHAAGDEILTTVAGCIASAVHRSVDVVARYGGEEFTVVLPDTGQEGAVHVAETIRRNVQALAIANPGSETGYVTVSVGCATCVPAVGITPEKLVSVADEQLYEAKSSGRNQVRSIVFAPTQVSRLSAG